MTTQSVDQCLAAHTGIQSGPGYVSYINAYEMDDGSIRITVRSEGEGPNVPTGVTYMSADDWGQFLARAVSNGSPVLLEAIGKALNDA